MGDEMAIVKVKPTSAGRAPRSRSSTRNCTRAAGRCAGREADQERRPTTTRSHDVRHQGGWPQQHYRLVDFRRNKDGIPAKVERIEYDPNRSAHIALLCYADGERRYIIAPRGITVGQQVISGAEAPIGGNALPIRNIPVGSTIHCIEMVPGQGCAAARAAGTSGPAAAREGSYAQLRLRSGESAACTSSAARPSARSVTKSMACARSARLARTAGAASARPFAAW